MFKPSKPLSKFNMITPYKKCRLTYNKKKCFISVLFAAEEYPELNAMIQRKFNQQGDVESAFK
jgi:hypothetical protein